MGKIEGVSTFSALFTTVNQYSEIRSMNFTPSKKHDDWAPILSAMLPSLTNFGHPQPRVIFTDNVRADKAKLLSVFPSLSANVTPVPRSDAFDELVVPSSWNKVELPTAHQVNLRFSTIMSHHSPTSPIVVAFGIQWPIDPVTGNEGRISLIEIAYQETVYLIKVSKHFVLSELSLTPFLMYRQGT
jgi:hypothetical protein